MMRRPTAREVDALLGIVGDDPEPEQRAQHTPGGVVLPWRATAGEVIQALDPAAYVSTERWAGS